MAAGVYTGLTMRFEPPAPYISMATMGARQECWQYTSKTNTELKKKYNKNMYVSSRITALDNTFVGYAILD